MLKGNPKRASEILTAIGTLTGVRDLDVDLNAGTVFVAYDALRISSEDLLEELARNGLERLLRATPCTARRSTTTIGSAVHVRSRSSRT